MNPYVIPPLLAVCLNFTLVYWVYQKAIPGLVRRMFLFWNSWLGLWNLGIAVGYVLPEAHMAYGWYKGISSTVIALIAPFFLHFVAAITESSDVRTRWVVRVGYGLGFGLSVTGALTSLLMKGVCRYFWGFYPLAGQGEWLFGVSYLALVLYAMHLLTKAARSADGDKRNQLRTLYLGALICFGSGCTNILPLYGVEVYPVGNLFNSLYSLLVAYAIFEYGLMEIRVIFRRGIVYAILSGGLTVVYLSMVAVLQRLFGHYGVQENVAFYTAAFPLTVVLAPTMKSHLEPFVDHTFFGVTRTKPASSLKIRQETALMGILATEMAHELAKPLTHIMNERSRMEQAAKGQHKASLEKIEKEAQRAVEILDGFALLSPDRPLHRIAFSLMELLEESLTALGLQEDGDIRIMRRFESLPPIWVNPGQMVQVFTNVIQNAWQAMREGGTLILSLHKMDPPVNASPLVEIVIEDTGLGIPVELQEKIFEPFFTTKNNHGGRGVGLTITRAMVERHGGHILVESPIHRKGGTRIHIRLPMLTMEGTAHGA